jgi:hypothetical protein
MIAIEQIVGEYRIDRENKSKLLLCKRFFVGMAHPTFIFYLCHYNNISDIS